MISQRLVAAVALAVVSCAHLSPAQQTPLASSIAYPEPLDANVNFTEVFSPYSDALSPGKWSRESWNGMTTFAHATPLRCFGSDDGVNYDVAVIGEHSPQRLREVYCSHDHHRRAV